MRIIAGSARGRTLCAPKGMDTRPTQDYVRESLFNILQQETPEARVLDLFAGSGALGLEALSRGAEFAAFADVSPSAIACITKNAEALGFVDSVSIVKADWQAALDRWAREHRTFSLIFLDPPYKMTEIEKISNHLSENALLDQGALLVIERWRGDQPHLNRPFKQKDVRQYGDTEIFFFCYNGKEDDNA
ncbi:MAG TPA: 16S rRNA (guanine(966)-N(2))-methyltransferase RsmD [Candidatus Limiplasma sp.]|jgi:16S rRNA (guanine966-N2)-methyltransferase|nr:16S rRNA (guanine(966)-N(2))-methyltransferase RsmD [Candidatus Limiplasma sp.]HPR77350.1 16S rRNA (guanine(966)-N(2))-methyltransferase RsmD [Candidatus Limiplasma sp.]